MDPRSRKRTPQRAEPPLRQRPLGTPCPPGLSTNTGPIAAAAWLANLGVMPDVPRWYVEITLGPAGETIDPDVDTGSPRLHIEIFAEEWGYRFSTGGKLSWIRVTDVPFVHGRDDHQLLEGTTSLKKLGTLVTQLERRSGVHFDRKSAIVRSSIFGSEAAVRGWLETL